MKNVSALSSPESCCYFVPIAVARQVPGGVPGEPTTKHRWMAPLESWAKRSLI